MITGEIPTDWKDLQNKVGEILSRCGFEVEIEKKVNSVRGIIEIDVYAEEQINGRKYSILCECKNWEANIPQTIVHSFRTIVTEIGSNIGYIITTSNFQSGAKVTAENTNITLLTWEQFQNLFFKSWFYKYFCLKINKELKMVEDYYFVNWYDNLSSEDKRHYLDTKNRLNEIFEIVNYFPTPFINELVNDLYPIPKLPLTDKLYKLDEYYGEIPIEILIEPYYQEFLEKFLLYAKRIITDFNKLSEKYNED